MEVNPHFWAGKRVCVTGGTGFLGRHLVQNLLPLTPHVRILGLQPAAPELNRWLGGQDCVVGDIRDAALVRRAVADCDVVFHAAGTIAMHGPALKQIHAIHVDGTQNVLQALPPGARLVHTSSVTAVGASTNRALLTEESPFELAGLKVAYVHAKRAAEELALAAAGRGLDVTVVNPGYLFGPEDFDRSGMLRICLRCWQGKVPLIPPGGLNCADVRDVARGHLLAAERGRPGRRYILGGDNLTIVELIRQLAAVRGLWTGWRPRVPAWLFGAIACAAELRAWLVKREPYPSMAQYRMSRLFWFYVCDRARGELAYRPRPFQETLRDTHDWACANGYVNTRGGQSVEERPPWLPRAAA
jgi:dihydroflavonol-4-reductase